jgi:hypothetical protein
MVVTVCGRARGEDDGFAGGVGCLWRREKEEERGLHEREREREQWHYYSFWWDGLEEKVRPPLFLTVLRWRG